MPFQPHPGKWRGTKEQFLCMGREEKMGQICVLINWHQLLDSICVVSGLRSRAGQLGHVCKSLEEMPRAAAAITEMCNLLFFSSDMQSCFLLSSFLEAALCFRCTAANWAALLSEQDFGVYWTLCSAAHTFVQCRCSADRNPMVQWSISAVCCTRGTSSSYCSFQIQQTRL